DRHGARRRLNLLPATIGRAQTRNRAYPDQSSALGARSLRLGPGDGSGSGRQTGATGRGTCRVIGPEADRHLRSSQAYASQRMERVTGDADGVGEQGDLRSRWHCRWEGRDQSVRGKTETQVWWVNLIW